MAAAHQIPHTSRILPDILMSGIVVAGIFLISFLLNYSTPDFLSSNIETNNINPLVYTYPIPEELLFPPDSHVTKESCFKKRDMYYMEILFPDLVRESAHATLNRSEADFFLIPHYSTCFYHACVFSNGYGGIDPAACKNATSDYLGRILETIESDVPWTLSSGTDHLVVFSWYILSTNYQRDQASEVLGWESPTRSLIAPTIHLTTLGSILPSPNFSPHKDIVIPSYADYSAVLSLYPASGSWITAARPLHAYFRGTILKDERYSWGVRQYLKELGRTHPEKYAVHVGHSLDYWVEMGQAQFSLCPSGWSAWSPRLFDSMMTGAVPVLFADGTRLPFEDVIDYEGFAVKVNNNGVHGLHQVLEGVVDVEEKREKAVENRMHVMWEHGGLAFSNVMGELGGKIRRKFLGNREFS
jgi:hypothetical protein